MPTRPRSTVHRHRTFWLGVLVIATLALPALLSTSRLLPGKGAATLIFSPPPKDLALGQVADIDLRLSSPRQAVNAVQAVIEVDPHQIELLGMTTQQSFCSFYAENTFDKIKGEVRLACGTPHPGFQGDSTVVSLRLRTKVVGTSQLTLRRSQSSVLADDGKGTNLLEPSSLSTLILTTHASL